MSNLTGKWVMIYDPPYQRVSKVIRETDKKVFLDNKVQFLKKHIATVFETFEEADKYCVKLRDLKEQINKLENEKYEYIKENRNYKFEG